MKLSIRYCVALSFAVLLLLGGPLPAAPLGTLITYQGHLTSSGLAAEGSYDLQFSLHDTASGGLPVAGPLTNNGVLVSNGLFTVGLDFGAGAFDGQARWLEIAVRLGTNDFAILSSRQPVTPTPYALVAAKLDGVLPSAQVPANVARLDAMQTFTGTNHFNGTVVLVNPANTLAGAHVGQFTGDGSALTNLDNAAILAATNQLNIALNQQIVGSTNGLNAALVTRISDATNQLNASLTATIVAATNSLNSSLSAQIVGATNNLNTALVTRLTDVTNQLNASLTATIVAATNDLNNSLSARITAATNVLNSSLSAQIVGATNASWNASTNWILSQGFQLTNGVTRKPIATPTPASGTNFVADFLNEAVQITATNNINFLQSTNRTAAGWYGESVWYIQGGTTNRTLKFNPSWVGLGTLATNSPYLIASNKLIIVAFSVRGAGETNVVYAISRQE